MPLTRIACTHLVYQFIILTLLLMMIGSYVLLPDQKHVLLVVFAPLFLYQLIALCCWTELVPVPGWMNPAETPKREDTREQSEPDNLLIKDLVVSPNTAPNGMRSRSYKFRHWKSTSNSVYSQASENKTATLPMDTNWDTLVEDSTTTKNYFFPHRQKRLEPWIDESGSHRPFKVRQWESGIQATEPDSRISNSEISSTTVKASDLLVPSTSPIQTGDIQKSYSYPFRYKKPENWSDARDFFEISVPDRTPYWDNLGCSVARRQVRKCKRSASSCAVPKRQLEVGDQKHKEFSQSLELKRDAEIVENRNTSKNPTNAFVKFKTGISNCFAKMKREAKIKDGKSSSEMSKRRSFKSLFQSRENINE